MCSCKTWPFEASFGTKELAGIAELQDLSGNGVKIKAIFNEWPVFNEWADFYLSIIFIY